MRNLMLSAVLVCGCGLVGCKSKEPAPADNPPAAKANCACGEACECDACKAGTPETCNCKS